ncbi:hypothetical protein ACWJJH_02420 [Endozoicomonadaceae bacterium StTr2]
MSFSDESFNGQAFIQVSVEGSYNNSGDEDEGDEFPVTPLDIYIMELLDKTCSDYTYTAFCDDLENNSLIYGRGVALIASSILNPDCDDGESGCSPCILAKAMKRAIAIHGHTCVVLNLSCLHGIQDYPGGINTVCQKLAYIIIMSVRQNADTTPALVDATLQCAFPRGAGLVMNELVSLVSQLREL